MVWPQVPRDIDQVIAELSARLPGLEWERLNVTHAADDGGIWFFVLGSREVQVESSKGACPFSVEADHTDERCTAQTVAEVVSKVTEWLGH